MVKRVTAAIAAACREAATWGDEYCSPEMAEAAARAAIEAMREPTRLMILAGDLSDGATSGPTNLEVAWRAMIDAALRPPAT